MALVFRGSVDSVRTARHAGPVAGLLAQVALLAGLAVTVGLGTAGWLVGTGYSLVACAVLTRGMRRCGAEELGPADRVTLARAILVGGVAALTVDSFARSTPAGLPMVLVALAVVALVLDAVDGQVARRTGTATALGARFDVEVDAFLVLVLSVYVTHTMGGWVLMIGLIRYAFVATAICPLPWMRGSLPPRYWRKVVAAAQGSVLVVAAAELLPPPLTAAALVAVLALLLESFGRDVGWLWQRRLVRAVR